MNYDNFIKNNCGDIIILDEYSLRYKDDMTVSHIHLSEYDADVLITLNNLNKRDNKNLSFKKVISFIPFIRNLIKMRGYNNGKCNVKYKMAYIKWFPGQGDIDEPHTYIIAYLGDHPTSSNWVVKIEMFDHDLKF